MASKDFQATPVERFNQDGLAYDATFMIEGGKAFPIAFGESITQQEDQSNVAFFTSARGRRSVSFRGKAPRSWSVSMNMPWDYTSMLAMYVESQRTPRFLMTPLARRNNIMAPATEGPTLWVGTVGDSPNKSFGTLVENYFTSSDGYYIPTYWVDSAVGDAIYGNETWVIPGTTVRFRVFARGKGTVRLWGKNGSSFITDAPLVTMQIDSTEMKEYISSPITIPQNVQAVVDAYHQLIEFSPMQMWIGTHIPPVSPRLGAWAVIKDFGYSHEVFVQNKLIKSSFTISEVW